MSAENNYYAFLHDVPYRDGPEVHLANPRSKLSKAAKIAGTGLGALALAGGELHWINSHPGEVAELSRDTLGIRITSEIEGIKFDIDDRIRRWKYDHFGGEENPFSENQTFVTNAPTPEAIPTIEPSPSTSSFPETTVFEQPKTIDPFILPDTHLLLPNPKPGEGSWSIDGLPTTKETLIMAKTFIRSDPKRPDSSVGILVLDSRRVQLHAVGGKGNWESGGGQGPGKVLDQDLSNLLLVLNSGFKVGHPQSKWGVLLDGIEYKALQPGKASLVIYKDGTFKIGAWGEGSLEKKTEDMKSIRQNAVLLLDKGELTEAVKNEDDVQTWGLIAANSNEFITWRSAIGVTKEGHLVIADASNMSALNLARGMKAADVYTAMQLDINLPWVQTGVVSGHTAEGKPIVYPFMNGMESGSKFVNSAQERDLIYVTRDDDSRYKPE